MKENLLYLQLTILKEELLSNILMLYAQISLLEQIFSQTLLHLLLTSLEADLIHIEEN